MTTSAELLNRICTSISQESEENDSDWNVLSASGDVPTVKFWKVGGNTFENECIPSNPNSSLCAGAFRQVQIFYVSMISKEVGTWFSFRRPAGATAGGDQLGEISNFGDRPY